MKSLQYNFLAALVIEFVRHERKAMDFLLNLVFIRFECFSAPINLNLIGYCTLIYAGKSILF